ncbi:MICOS complex subunit mic25a isoform X2 [Oryzias melastigma]|uniref:MICOS complex subunit mic25a isoform X2 n=1 Tax=Oryzias melastigma TaxID=30732 RepID=UPI00168D1FB6|nr:MICOS complex subunit mic25a isoform X2 [Oryzias melastigma]
MGANGSSARNVSFGLDDDKKVTVIEGVRLSGDVLRRMREAQESGKPKPSTGPPEGHKPEAKPEGVSTKEAQEEMRKNFEHQQALVQEQLAKLAQREKEISAAAGLKDSSAAAIMERGRAHHEQEKAKMLGKQLERKEAELATLSTFYKEQLEILEKKSFEEAPTAPTVRSSPPPLTQMGSDRTWTTTSRRLKSTTRQLVELKLTYDPGGLKLSALTCRPRCSSATEKTPSRLCSAPAWPNNT